MEQILIFIIVVFSLFASAFCMINPHCCCFCCWCYFECCECLECCCLFTYSLPVFVDNKPDATNNDSSDNKRTEEIKDEPIENGFSASDHSTIV